jgi:hypothetical protein
MSPQPRRHASALKSTVRLTPERLARAVTANALWAKKLGWIQHTDAIAVLTGSPSVPASADFAQAVARWQVAHQLDADGILGPITWREIRHALTPPDSLITVLPSDAPPPDGFEAIIATFGDPRPLLTNGSLSPDNEIIWERQTLARGQFPFPLALKRDDPSAGVARSFQAHRRLVSVFEAVFAEIARVGLADAIHSYHGIYAFRPIRGINARLSLHAFGAAIDLNADTNPLGGDGDMNPDVVAVFKHFGFRWGGDFAGRKDPMHFQYATGY